jgi:alkanesulfonate monooxygenase SsuD/methylene tetrahydromethanopterin reductase-like flavin-dependent oxidoreductase (luciferase family)
MTPFKLGFFTQVNGAAEQSPRELYRHLTEVVVAAEELGYESVWVGQHHFGLGNGRLPSPLVLLSAIAERTTTIKLGTAIIPLPFEDPVRLAEDAAVLDEISGGRLNLGVGAGGGDFGAWPAFGLDMEDRRSLFDQKLQKLHALTAGEPIGGGEEPVHLFPEPNGLRDRIWQSAGSTERAASAAVAGDGLLIGAFWDHPLHEQRAKIDAYLKQWAVSQAETGRQPRIGVLRFTYLGADRGSIERQLDADLTTFRREFVHVHRPALEPLSTSEYLRQVIRYGNTDDIISDLREDPALLGFATDFLPTVGLFPAAGNATPGADLDIARLEHFAKEVAPALGWTPAAKRTEPERADALAIAGPNRSE